jgi:hypothetical protein
MAQRGLGVGCVLVDTRRTVELSGVDGRLGEDRRFDLHPGDRLAEDDGGDYRSMHT